MTDNKTPNRKKNAAAKGKKVTKKVTSETVAGTGVTTTTTDSQPAARSQTAAKSTKAPTAKTTPAVKTTPAAEKAPAAETTAHAASAQAKSSVSPAIPSQPDQSTTGAANMNASAASSSGGGRGLALFAVLLGLASLVLSGYLLYSNVLQQQSATTSIAVGVTEIKNNVQRFGESVTQLQSEMGDIDQRLQGFATTETVEQSVQNSLQPYAEQQQALSESLQQLSQEVSGDQGQFAYDRIRQLLETANSQIGVHRNTERALVALQLTESQLQSLNDPRLSAVRSKVLEEISELQDVQLPDIARLASQLNQLIKEVPEWPLQNEPNAQLVEVAASEHDDVNWWSRISTAVKEVFTQTFQVNKVDTPPKPLLAPEQRYFLNQNLGLRLLSAQQALLQQQQRVFDDNLNEAMAWITEYFDSRDARVQGALAELAEIQATDLQPELPDVSGSLGALNQVQGN